MFGQFRAPQPVAALTGPAAMNQSGSRGVIPRIAVGLGTASISVMFLFNLDGRVDQEAIEDLFSKACYIPPNSEEGNNGGTNVVSTLPAFIQFRRVPNETFGIALFRSAAPAARAMRALTGVQLFGKELFAQMDKRSLQLLEQWRYLRSKELGSKIASQGYEIPSNILELVNNELNEQVSRAKGLVVESASLHELRITRFQGLDEAQVLFKQEEERIQDVLVRRAEEAGKVDKANSELRALIAQLREQERALEAIDRASEKTERELKTKRKFELKTKSITGNPSVFEIRQLVPTDRDSLFSQHIDWDGIFGAPRAGTKPSPVVSSLTPWLVRKVKDFMGCYDREMVEYVLRRVRLRTDPLELITDLGQYIDEEAEEFVKQIWTVLVFETLRRQHSPSPPLEAKYFVSFLLDGIPPSVGESGFEATQDSSGQHDGSDNRRQ